MFSKRGESSFLLKPNPPGYLSDVTTPPPLTCGSPSLAPGRGRKRCQPLRSFPLRKEEQRLRAPGETPDRLSRLPPGC